MMPLRRILARAWIAALVATFFVVAAQQPAKGQAAQQSPQQGDIEALVRLVDAVGAGEQEAPGAVPIRWVSNHFIKGQGNETYIPFTLAVNRTQLQRATVALYVRVVDRRQPAPAAGAERVRYPWDHLNFVDLPADGSVSRAIALPPGDYDVFIAVKQAATADEAAADRVGVLRHQLTVPDYGAPGLLTSSVILAREMELLPAPLPPEMQEEQPYVFGPMRIEPASDARFGKMGELQVIFWIYGARATGAGKPDVEVEYLFHHRLPEGEKYFNRTEPQALNAETLPPEFSMEAGHQLPGSVVVPLEIFPAGDYRLEIKVNDKVSGESVTRNMNFTVLPS
jgi:hypothetical protein